MLDPYVRERMMREARGLPVPQPKQPNEIRKQADALAEGKLKPEDLEERTREWMTLPERYQPKDIAAVATLPVVEDPVEWVERVAPLPVEYQTMKSGTLTGVLGGVQVGPAPVSSPEDVQRIFDELRQTMAQAKCQVQTEEKKPDLFGGSFRSANVLLAAEEVGDFGFPVMHAQLVPSEQLGNLLLLVYDTSSNVYFVPRVSKPGKPPLLYEARVSFNDANGSATNYGRFYHVGLEYKIGRLLHIVLFAEVQAEEDDMIKQGDVRADTPDLRPSEVQALDAEWTDELMQARREEVERKSDAQLGKAAAVDSVVKTLG